MAGHDHHRIAVVAGSGPLPAEPVQRGLELLRQRGHAPIDLCTRLRPRGYLAASDGERLTGLVRALTDPQVDVVWAARGGYGLMRLLADLPWERLAGVAPRWVVGFSDMTALLLPLAARLPRWGLVHGPNVCGLAGAGEDDRAALWALLEQGQAPRLEGLACWQGGQAEGMLTGGNLCLISHLAGTPFLPPPAADRLLLLEDVGERPYRLDRMLTQLGLAGWLDGICGVLLGEFRGCDDADGRAEDVLRELLGRWLPGVPVAAGLPVGHGRRNVPLRLGQRLRLDADAGVLLPLAPGTVPGTVPGAPDHG